VDVFQEWSGPCDAIVSNFRRIKNELGDDLLHFAMVSPIFWCTVPSSQLSFIEA